LGPLKGALQGLADDDELKHGAREELRRSAESFARPANIVLCKGGKSVLIMENNLNFVKDAPMINVNFIITGMTVSAKK
jgi:hypothetical protein